MTARKTSTKRAAKKAAKKTSARKKNARKSATKKSLKKGDHVAWNTSQGETRGVVVKKLTSPRSIKTHKVAASPDNPEYLVESDKSGEVAAHKPASLRKVAAKRSTKSARD